MKNLFCTLAILFFSQWSLAQSHTISSIKIHKMSPNSMKLAVSPGQDFYAMVHTGVDSLILLHFDQTGHHDWGSRMDRSLQNAFELVALKDGDALFAALDYEGPGPSSIFIGKISNKGVLRWAKRLDHTKGLIVGKLTTMEDAFLLSCGTSIGPTIGFLIKFDNAGNMLWEKSFSGMSFGNAVEMPGRNICALVYTNTIGITHTPKIFQLTANGTLVWAKEFNGGYNLDLFTIQGTTDNAIICAGRASDGPFIYPDYWLMKITQDGDLVWSNTYAYPDGSNIGYTYYYQLCLKPNGGIYLQFSSGNVNSLLCFGKEGQFQYAWKIPQAKNLTDLENIGNSDLLSIGEQYSGNSDYELDIFRLDSLGRLDACCADSVFLLGSSQDTEVHDVHPVQGMEDVKIITETLSFVPLGYAVDKTCALPGILPSNTIICPGECIDFQILDLTTTNGNLDFSWSFMGGSPDHAVTDIPGSICYSTPGQYPVVLKIKQGECQRETRDSVEVCSPDILPTAFTPNGDGANDTFKPILYFPVSAYHLTIYNRWGQKVFETFDYKAAWDGSYSSQGQVSDVYLWTLDFIEMRPNHPQQKFLMGELTLIR
ncbi:MAG: gliding motility-associated C-terminal domain-containing protein [Saprospiraceae bacterium]